MVIYYHKSYCLSIISEELLETTDDLSPLTLEMVQTALISLKQKKSIAMEQSRQLLARQEQLMARGVGRVTDQQLKEARNYFPSVEKIAVKGKAPLLLPHQGESNQENNSTETPCCRQQPSLTKLFLIRSR